jgi:hypothetical protein
MDRKASIVIRAGLSGLAAAYELTKARWKVTVLEGRERTGGRVRTFGFRDDPHLHCELGGEWVGRRHTHMKTLCNEFGLKQKELSNPVASWDQVRRNSEARSNPEELSTIWLHKAVRYQLRFLISVQRYEPGSCRLCWLRDLLILFYLTLKEFRIDSECYQLHMSGFLRCISSAPSKHRSLKLPIFSLATRAATCANLGHPTFSAVRV